jgi:ATP-dependent DNA helicase RecG
LLTGQKITTEGRQRIKTMVDTNDGFQIAEVDLRLRGPGDLAGTQQSGILDLKLADVIRDEKILKAARELAIEILEMDKMLELPANAILRRELNRIDKRQNDFSRIS